MERLMNIHPGEILLEEFLKPLSISAYKLSKDIGIPQTRTSEIIKGNRSITADTALRLSCYFGNWQKMRHTLLAPGQLYGSPAGEYQDSCRMLRRVTPTKHTAGPLGTILRLN
jgi:addiction module HigA family antidote